MRCFALSFVNLETSSGFLLAEQEPVCELQSEVF